MKRAYWGVRVLPSEVVNLDYQSSLTQWELPESQQNLGVQQLTTGRVLLHAIFDMSNSGGCCIYVLLSCKQLH
ncbi:hypothetical protein CHARACLAT_033073 [Characodon lateralis]|uniref:Uncharacterized protein n=1 Tax=Characodon lateralis TaxID=208331 RepID=A0ABU7E5V0_9TELE|nr:hypothetical protein [Characodon lateralis]